MVSHFILRWTIGNVSPFGFEVLEESIKKAKQIFKNEAEYIVLYNGPKPNVPATCIQQNWSDLPIQINHEYHLEKDVHNAIWKVAPPRLDFTKHEILIDNDLIILKRFKELDKFLHSDSILCLVDPLRYYGSLDFAVPENIQINSGFLGLPRQFDFGTAIRTKWDQLRRPRIAWSDEQGLLVASLLSSNLSKIIIPKEKIPQCHPNGIWENWDGVESPKRFMLTGEEYGVHFTEINRNSVYKPWNEFKEIYCKKVLF